MPIIVAPALIARAAALHCLGKLRKRRGRSNEGEFRAKANVGRSKFHKNQEVFARAGAKNAGLLKQPSLVEKSKSIRGEPVSFGGLRRCGVVYRFGFWGILRSVC